jgi:hypothetical protein
MGANGRALAGGRFGQFATIADENQTGAAGHLGALTSFFWLPHIPSLGSDCVNGRDSENKLGGWKFHPA